MSTVGAGGMPQRAPEEHGTPRCPGPLKVGKPIPQTGRHPQVSYTSLKALTLASAPFPGAHGELAGQGKEGLYTPSEDTEFPLTQKSTQNRPS